MRAILFDQPGGAENLYLGEYADPRPTEHELLVRVAATALNRADVMQRMGHYPPPPGASPILGLEMAGEVIGVGAGVTQYQIGDRVCGLLPGGGYAEQAVIHESLAIPVPDHMPWAVAAAIPEVFLTAWQSLHELADVQPGETVLIHAGASGVGTAAIQLVRHLGASAWVTASAAKHTLCHRLGAQLAIDYHQENFAEAIADYSQGKGVQVVIDFIGAPYFLRNLDVLTTDGRLVMLAFLGGAKVDGVNLAKVLMKRLRIIGSTLRARNLDYKAQLVRSFREKVWPAILRGEVAPVIDSAYDWQKVADAHRRMERNENAGKIVLHINDL